MYYHASVTNQIRRILIKNNLIDNDNDTNKTISNDDLTDIKDGRLYKQLLNQPNIKKLIDNNAAYTFTLNTDGISFCEKSKLTMWPIYLVINEISIDKRYCIDNVIIAGNFDFFFLFS